MIPQEKAQELWSKYRPIIAGKQFVTGFVLMSEANELTKQCALIAVDEMLSNDGWSGSMEEWHRFKIYFEEVKQEIEKL